MKKIINLLFIGVGLVATSCSEVEEYELPYEVAPTTQMEVTEIAVTPSNSLCPGPEVDFSVNSEGTVYYVPVPAEEDAPTSFEVWDAGSILPAGEFVSGVGSANLEINALGDYVLYAITVNEHGVRSEEVFSADFSTSTLEEVVQANVGSEYVASPSAFGSNAPQFAATLNEEGETVFSTESLWGPNFVAWATGNDGYAGMMTYPGTITVNSDFSVTVESDEDLGGEGMYDPCTGTFNISIFTELFDADPDTEELEPTQVDVEFVKASSFE